MKSRKGIPKGLTTEASTSPSVRDLEWAAGFLEGEGSFGLTSPTRYGTRGQRVSCRQVQKEPVLKLQFLFGGSLCLVTPLTNKLSVRPIWDWTAYGKRARGLMMTLYSLMSEQRKHQIRVALQGKKTYRQTLREESQGATTGRT